MSDKTTHFRVTQIHDVHSADCHSVKEFAMSHFGTEELPKHVKVEIVKASLSPKEADGQADKPAA